MANDKTKSEVGHDYGSILYRSRDSRLIIKVGRTGEVKFVHDLKHAEAIAYRARALATLTAKAEKWLEVVNEYAPGASSRTDAEKQHATLAATIDALNEMWPPKYYDPELPEHKRPFAPDVEAAPDTIVTEELPPDAEAAE